MRYGRKMEVAKRLSETLIFKGDFMLFLGFSLKMTKFAYEFPRFFGGVFRFRKSRLGVMVFHDFRESKTMSIAQVTVVHLIGHFAIFHKNPSHFGQLSTAEST